MMRMFGRAFWWKMHQGALDPIQAQCDRRLIPAQIQWHMALPQRSGGKASVCPVVKFVLWLILGIARKARIKRGLLHASLTLPTNKIIHFYQVCALSFSISCSSVRQGKDWQAPSERTERGNEDRMREGERKKSPSMNAECRAFKCEPFFQEQIAALAELFKGPDDQLSRAPF